MSNDENCERESGNGNGADARDRTPTMSDQFDLQRFVKAQDLVFDRVLEELGNRRKRSHWMWYVFPQIEGLGSSSIAKAFSISSREEAVAYLEHDVLGPRLRRCTRLVLDAEDSSLAQIFGSPDDMKFKSSMTLFAYAGSRDVVFRSALNKFCSGEEDWRTVAILEDNA